jgi:hypothetical protein
MPALRKFRYKKKPSSKNSGEEGHIRTELRLFVEYSAYFFEKITKIPPNVNFWLSCVLHLDAVF